MSAFLLAALLAAPARAAGVEESSAAGKGFSWRMSLPVTGLPAADAAMRAWAKAQLSDFLERAKEPPANPDWRCEFILTASSFAPSGRVRSWRLDAWSFTGGAHGGTESEAFVFDGTRRLALADLFKPGAPWLEALSRRALVERAAKAVPGVDGDWLTRGAGPDPENYRLFALDGQDLVIRFPPYQVAPYSEGPQDFRVPSSDLRGLLRR